MNVPPRRNQPHTHYRIIACIMIVILLITLAIANAIVNYRAKHNWENYHGFANPLHKYNYCDTTMFII